MTVQIEAMSERQQKGLEIYKRGQFKRKGDLYLVPSQTNPGTYIVDRDGDCPSCSCPDFELNQQPCKHVYAVEYIVAREIKPDGTTTETRTVRVTYFAELARIQRGSDA
jgi:predicted nucleic acid-binding Zn finger protein